MALLAHKCILRRCLARGAQGTLGRKLGWERIEGGIGTWRRLHDDSIAVIRYCFDIDRYLTSILPSFSQFDLQAECTCLLAREHGVLLQRLSSLQSSEHPDPTRPLTAHILERSARSATRGQLSAKSRLISLLGRARCRRVRWVG